MTFIDAALCLAVHLVTATNVLAFASDDDEERPYRVVSASEGGWPLSLVSGPFEPGEVVGCHKDVGVCGREGVDLVLDSLDCQVESMVNTSHVRVDCEGVPTNKAVPAKQVARYLHCTVERKMNETHLQVLCDEEKRLTMPIECCERVNLEDAVIFSTPHGHVHYTSFLSRATPLMLGGPGPIVKSMAALERKYYPDSPRVSAGLPPLLLYYTTCLFHRDVDFHWEGPEDRNIPLRVEQSPRYWQQFHQTLNTSMADLLENKWMIAKSLQERGLNVPGGPFPITYFSCKEALDATINEAPMMKFYIKPVLGWNGRGIEVKTRSQLQELMENDACVYGTNQTEVIMEGVSDLALLSKRRFDIRFYFLIHAGRVYMHQTGVIKSHKGPTYNRTSAEDALAFVQRYSLGSSRHVYFSDQTTEKGKQWLDAVYSQLVAVLPVMEPIIQATIEDKTLYQIFGGDALIRENGVAVFVELNYWPYVGPRILGSLSADGEQLHDFNSVEDRVENTDEIMLTDFFAIALGLVDAAALDGRVHEVIPILDSKDDEL